MSEDQRSCWASRLHSEWCGTALLVLSSIALLVQEPSPAQATGLLAETAVAHQIGDTVWVAVSLHNPGEKPLQGILFIDLCNTQSRSLGLMKKEIWQTSPRAMYRFWWRMAGLKTNDLRVRCHFGSDRVEIPLPAILAKAHETSLAANQEYHSGTSASLRCHVRGITSIAGPVPLPGAQVEVKLRTRDGTVYPLYSGKTGDDGNICASFQVPQLLAGEYKLEVATMSPLGKDKLEHTVRLKSEAKILLVTDKPLYQPGQLIHLRALCLRPFDLAPIAHRDLVFEIEDAKGNKVFKRSLKTSDFGIAAVDFPLADEVNMGAYQVRALIDDQQAQKTVQVKRYVLPRFKIAITADKKFYLPRESIQVDVQTDYFFGKPVANSKVKVTASTFDVQFKDFQTWEGKTDANGHARLEVKLPDYFVGQPLQKGDALVKLEVKVTDTADHTETVNRTYPVAEQPIRISLIPEGGRLLPNLENRIFAAAVYPDGSPAAGCEIKFWKGLQSQGKPHTIDRTNAAGLVEVRMTPRGADFRKGGMGPLSIETLGGEIREAWAEQTLFDVAVEARDAQGNVGRALAALNAETFGDHLLLRLDKAVYRAGDSLNLTVLTSTGMPTVYLDIIKSGQTVLTNWLDVKNGQASHRLELPPGLFGTLEVHAYQVLGTGEIVRDTRVVYVHSRNDLKIQAKADRDVYLPGQAGMIRFQVTNAAGRPRAAALGVVVVDEAVYALQEMQPGLEKVYFTLQQELLKPRVQRIALPQAGDGPPPAPFRPEESLDDLVRVPALSPEKQRIAEVLLTAVRPRPPSRWMVVSAIERRQKLTAALSPRTIPGLGGLGGLGMGAMGIGGIGMMGGMGGYGMGGGGGGSGGGMGMPGTGGNAGMPSPPTVANPRLAPAEVPAGSNEPAKPVRLREFFPENLFWQPALITDNHGRAELPLTFADSITTWRLSASASSRNGALGGLSAPLRVFQDFFVDLDLPVNLTQNDEVAFPVAVYNYLKTPQSVTLNLQRDSWFDLVDPDGYTRVLDVKPGDVTAVKFRIRAQKIGQHPLTVRATGSKMSDAVKRSVEIIPDGKLIEQVVNDRLSGTVKQTMTIPLEAIPDSYKLMVKLYPGVFSQVLEGIDGMLRLPGG
jgi:5-hydroxyisourate hydrolase-like protein (transthyretin family)